MKFAPEYRPLILSGKKRCTTRLEQKVEKDQYFLAEFSKGEPIPCMCTNSFVAPVSIVVHSYYSQEGFKNYQDFLNALKTHYPDIALDSKVYVHRFRVLAPEEL